MAGLLSDEELIDELYGPNADTVDADVYRRFGLTPNLKRGTVLPIARDEQGNLTPAVPQAIIDFLKAVSLPGHVARGGQYTPSDVTEMALNTGLLGTVATKPAGALASGLARNAAKLPMDEASRMARAKEQGFDVESTLYHGTQNPDFTEFRIGPSRTGSTSEPGTFLTKDPAVADLYAGYNPPDAPFPFEKTGAVLPVHARPGRQLVVDMQGSKHGRPEAIQRAVAEGYDSVLLKNHFDAGGVQDQVVVLDPANIRSRFAAFDPAKRDSADLLAGVAGLPGVASFLDRVNKDSRKRGFSKVTK